MRGRCDKRWFIDYGLFNQIRKKLETKRIWLPTNPQNADYHYQLAKELSTKIDKKLQKGIIYEPPKKEKKKELKNFLEISDKVLSDLVISNEIRPKSKKTYFSACKLLNAYLAKKSLSISDINHSMISDFTKSLQKSTSYKKTTVSHLKAVFTHLAKSSLIEFNYFKDYEDKLKVTESDLNYPFSDYEKAIIEDHLQANNPALYALTRFIFYAFIRSTELINLKIKDIDLRTRTIKVSGEISKNKRTETVPIIKPLLDIIIENKIMQNPSDYYIFGEDCKPSKTKLGLNTATNLHRDMLKRLGIYVHRATVLYSWKHTGNIFAYLAGVDIKLIQKMNRHASLETTEIYLRKLGLFLEKKAYDASW